MIAAITGSSRGIGRATALALARRGVDLALLSRPSEQQRQTEADCRALGVRAVTYPCDVADEAAVGRAATALVDELGAPDAVINNAAILARGPRVWETPVAEWDRVLGVNLRGAFLVCRALLPAMIEAAKGRLVHVASISGTIGCPQQAAYGVSKWGLLGLHRALTEELRGTGVLSIAVLPGSVDTEMLAQTPFRADMGPDDVAGVIAYLVLDAPAGVHGASLEVFG
jgi:3-oxoacyl-[acyl-carrier protein] reductase